MAIPPEPIEEVMPTVTAAVMAEVTMILKQGYQPPPSGDPSVTSKPELAAEQLVELNVTEVLFGPVKAGTKVVAKKPPAGYALRAGVKGPFLLKDTADGVEIAGRYGPDTYHEQLVRSVAKQR